MGQPRVLLITKDYRTRTTFHRQFQDYFGDALQVLSPNEVDDYENVDLILVSSRELFSAAFPADKVLVARRAIDIARLEELVGLPNDANCLVVNNLRHTAYETIELLQNLGFTFNMTPYYPGMVQAVPKVDIAIIPAGIELVPKAMKRVIDIGVRAMDLSTIMEISVRLHLPLDKANIYVARYVHEIVALSKKLSSTLARLKNVNSTLDAILNTVHDGIVATDAQGHIVRMNKSAAKILSIPTHPNKCIGEPITTLFPDVIPNETPLKVQENLLLTIKDKHLVVNNTPLEIHGQQQGLVTAFQDVTRIQQLERHLRKELQSRGLLSRYTKEHILGRSQLIKDTLKIMEKVANTDMTVLILGESGTGKELVAHSIHDLSPRRDGPFLPVNFAGLPESLAESELFGYDEGSFTGAKKGGKPGLFELAQNGTIFLDEIGDAPLTLQALLLRVLQERQVMRVGGNKVVPVDVRVIAATNRNLKELVAEGKFRQDLYYRLNVLPVRIPSLRQRKEDVPLLVEHFVSEFAQGGVRVPSEVMQKLVQYDWPGNVREVVSVVQYMVSVMDGDTVTSRDLPEQFHANVHAEQRWSPPVPQSDFLDTLKQSGKLNDFYVILRCLAEAKERNQGFGRGKIVRYCDQSGIIISDQQVRRRMETLAGLGLLKSGIRGQGSQVTSKGLEALRMMHDRLHNDADGRKTASVDRG